MTAHEYLRATLTKRREAASAVQKRRDALYAALASAKDSEQTLLRKLIGAEQALMLTLEHQARDLESLLRGV